MENHNLWNVLPIHRLRALSIESDSHAPSKVLRVFKWIEQPHEWQHELTTNWRLSQTMTNTADDDKCSEDDDSMLTATYSGNWPHQWQWRLDNQPNSNDNLTLSPMMTTTTWEQWCSAEEKQRTWRGDQWLNNQPSNNDDDYGDDKQIVNAQSIDCDHNP